MGWRAEYKCKKDVGVAHAQVEDILIKYLREHPEDRHIILAFSAVFAYQESLGCTQTPPKAQQVTSKSQNEGALMLYLLWFGRSRNRV